MYWVRNETLNDLIKQAQADPLIMNGPTFHNQIYLAVCNAPDAEQMMSDLWTSAGPTSDYHRLTIPVIVERYAVHNGHWTATGSPDVTVTEKRYLARGPSFIPYEHQKRLKVIHGREDDATRLQPTMERWLVDNLVDKWSWDGLFTFAFRSFDDFALFKMRWS